MQPIQDPTSPILIDITQTLEPRFGLTMLVEFRMCASGLTKRVPHKSFPKDDGYFTASRNVPPFCKMLFHSLATTQFCTGWHSHLHWYANGMCIRSETSSINDAASKLKQVQRTERLRATQLRGIQNATGMKQNLQTQLKPDRQAYTRSA